MKGQIITAAAAAVILTACGGGGGGGGGSNSTPASTNQSAAGLYTGSTDTNRQTSVLVLDNGRVYSLYSVVGQPSVIAGGVVGTFTSSSNGTSIGTGFDYNLEGQGTESVGVNATYTPRSSLTATIGYPNGAKTVFNGKYDSSYDTTPTQATVTGTFKGTSVTNLGSDSNVAITADANGSITGTGTGCSFTGTIKPHASGNVYDVNLNFGAYPCAYPNTSASGVAVVNNSVMHAILQTGSYAGVLFLGTKQ
ncbi:MULTISPECIES: hypothetical protein [unclassified Caballeronia]|uniref:hypothetical protein n=1 Tax=unclassified Caballeronia TaxID=2646786 RepID=UPI002029A93A|nr:MULTISPECIES: hypothetical protein [unclassified Caballeronia]